MKKRLITSIVTGIAILSISAAPIYAMGGGGGMGGDGGMGGGMHESSGQVRSGMSGSSSNSGTMHNSDTMYNNTQQHMTDENHAVLQDQHMGDAGAVMGGAGSGNNTLREGSMMIDNQGAADGYASGN